MEFGNRVCIGNIRGEFYEETGTKPEDAENFVDYARSLEGVEIGVLVEDRSGKLRVAFGQRIKNSESTFLQRILRAEDMHVQLGFNVSVGFDDFYPILVKKIGEHLEMVVKGEL